MQAGENDDEGRTDTAFNVMKNLPGLKEGFVFLYAVCGQDTSAL